MKSVRDLDRGILDVPTLGVDTLRGRLLFAFRETNEGGFVWVLEVVVGDFRWRTRLKRWGAECDHCRQCWRERGGGMKSSPV